jgi:uncharacterized membrane protein
VQPVNIPVQDAMRSIISCGAGTAKLLQGLPVEQSPGRRD